MNSFFEGEIKTIKKGDLLQKAHVVSKHAFKVVEGCLKSYVLDAAGKEHIIQFAPEDWIIGDMNSSINKLPSILFVEAIEDTTVMLLPYYNLEEMALLSKEDLLALNAKFTKNIIAINKRLVSLLATTAEERYLEFLETYPQLFQRLPLKLIASYLGMTPEYLSEVRKKLARK